MDDSASVTSDESKINCEQELKDDQTELDVVKKQLQFWQNQYRYFSYIRLFGTK
jgi:hypothetical protein